MATPVPRVAANTKAIQSDNPDRRDNMNRRTNLMATGLLAPVVLLGGWTQTALGQDQSTSDWTMFAPSGEDYVGGRGLITLEGMTGMFLNPTSGTLNEGQFTVQYCAVLTYKNGGNEVQHTAMASYGVTDWLELGVFGRVTDLANSNTNLGAGGPLVRMRLLKDEDWLPELSIGAMLREGNSRLTKRTLYLAASKRFVVDEEGFLRSVRVHAGVRQIWQDADFNNPRGTIGYIGGELELPHDLFVVGEVSTRSNLVDKTPYSIGIQWRPEQSIGISLAAAQSGGSEDPALYAGIGISF